MGLRELAEECGVTTEHIDGLGRACHASDAAMLSVLRALGVDIDSAEEADGIREARSKRPQPLAQPCLAVRAERESHLDLAGDAADRFRATLVLESGETRIQEGSLGDLQHTSAGYQLPLAALPVGYHRVQVKCGKREAECTVLAAPAKAWGAPDGRKEWGVFAPTYALRGEHDYGIGDFGCLSGIMDWASSLGANYVGTLPLLAANYREDFQTSPYSPVSRFFWNEMYLDLESLATQYPSSALSDLLATDAHQNERRALRDLSQVDYASCDRLKREVLQCICKTAWEFEGAELESALQANPELHRYAAFRATAEKSRQTWPEWDAAQQRGQLAKSDYDDESYRYHVFAQWAVDRQLQLLAEKPCRLYLDLSVGATGSSYDVWRYRDSFVQGVDVGAPPDGLFEGGQNWALPPLHPERSRIGGHAYFAQCVRANMRHAGMLRIDHVMGLHRLYWVPSELGATEGLYVRYPAEELYAVLLIESQRQHCALAGEDLGTVPDSVRPAMEEAGMHRLYVGQFSTQWREHEQHLGLESPPASAIASLDTHDTATFAGWFDSTDLQCDAEHLMKSWTEELAAGPAAMVVLTLEDLWLEREPQNRPGTGPEEPNWRHRFPRDVAAITADKHMAGWLEFLGDLRAASQG